MVVSDPQSDELGLELPARDVLVELTSLASVAQALTARVEALRGLVQSADAKRPLEMRGTGGAEYDVELDGMRARCAFELAPDGSEAVTVLRVAPR